MVSSLQVIRPVIFIVTSTSAGSACWLCHPIYLSLEATEIIILIINYQYFTAIEYFVIIYQPIDLECYLIFTDLICSLKCAYSFAGFLISSSKAFRFFVSGQ